MSDEKQCLHCLLVDAVRKWAVANGAKDERSMTHAMGIHTMGSIVEAVMDILVMAPPAERREIFGFLFQQIMNGGIQTGMIQTADQPTTKHTIN